MVFHRSRSILKYAERLVYFQTQVGILDNILLLRIWRSSKSFIENLLRFSKDITKQLMRQHSMRHNKKGRHS